MNFEKDINEIISHFLEKHDKNGAAAAESLGVNTVTFWKWIKNGAPVSEALSTAVDRSGAYLVLPWRTVEEGQESIEAQSERIVELERRVESLTMERTALQGEVRALERMVEKLLAAQSQQGSSPVTQGSLLDDLPEKAAG